MYLTYVVILLYHYLYYVVYISNVVHILILDRVSVVGSKLSLLHMSPFPTLLFLSLEDFQSDAPFLEKKIKVLLPIVILRPPTKEIKVVFY